MVLCAWLILLASASPLPAADWPQWRGDAYRGAASSENLPDRLSLRWTRAFSPRRPAWEDPLNQDLMSYDRILEPVVLGNHLFIGFNDRDKVVALDIHTGEEVWTFFTDGPVRLPPAAWRDQVYFASDDGSLYCVEAESGRQVWKFRGGPSARKVLGNGRVISAWPARGGPVIRDGQVYFAASIWPFMGTFIYALDARTGDVQWVNDSTGAQYLKQPHSAPAFAGIAPQGAFTATQDYLLVPGGRSVPAVFERSTGKFIHFQLNDGGKGNGGSLVLANESEFFVHTRLRNTRAFELKTGKKTGFTINEPVLTADGLYASEEQSFLKTAEVEAEQTRAAARQTEADAKVKFDTARDGTNTTAYTKATEELAKATRTLTDAEQALLNARRALTTNWAGCVIQARHPDRTLRWELPVKGVGELIKAGDRLYCALTNSIIAVRLPSYGVPPRVAWSNEVEGPVGRLLAANGHLFAVTLDGRLMAFGGEGDAPRQLAETLVSSPVEADAAKRATALLRKFGMPQGYALWFGVDDPALLEAVLRQSNLHVVGVDPDARKVERLRRYFDARGLYGGRVALHAGDPLSFKAPPYLASLVVVSASMAPRLADRASLQAIYESVRPYGGNLWVDVDAGAAAPLASQLKAAELPQAKISRHADGVTVVREGPLPGAADWTHQYGDVANTVKSEDQLVRLPLGLLWFGGNSHMDVLPRHGHGPSEQVVAGRLFLEGLSSLSARDVYTGRDLWKTDFGELGNFDVYYDASYTNLPLSTIYNQKHIPGANARGANFVATADTVYVVVSNVCHLLDARDGHRLRTLTLPRQARASEPPEWGFLGLYDDLLLAGYGFAQYSRQWPLAPTNDATLEISRPVDVSASRGLMALNPRTGRVLWQVEARHSFPHNGIVAGNGRVYCLDRLPQSVADKWKRRGRATPADYRLLALDARTGRLLWQTTSNVFGTWLSYSESRDVLLQAGASASDRLKDEAEQGMIAYRGADGAVRWRNLALKYTGPCILHHDTILTTPTSFKTNAGAFNLLDGTPRLVDNPLTGQPEPMRVYRTYGCNYPIASEYLMTFRSGAAGFYDLESNAGTGNFGGFKSGCSPNLIAANGVLNAPDYTRTCTCPYQNQTSLALVHTPELERELEVWTHHQFGVGGKDPVRLERVGINLGAPGNRLSATGTLWLDFPNDSGSLSNISVTMTGSRTNFFRRHVSQISGSVLPWVVASGVSGAESILIEPSLHLPPPKSAVVATNAPGEGKVEPEQFSKPEDISTNGLSSATSETRTNSLAASGPASPAAMMAEPYTVRLYFVEPEDLNPGERVFDVYLQGQPVLEGFDIVTEAGGRLRGVVKEFPGVLVRDQLAITMSWPADQEPGSILCGVEMIHEAASAGVTSAGQSP